MKWDDVVDNTVHVTSYKGRKKRKLIRAVPLPPQAVAAMGKRGTGLIFPTYTGTQWNRNNFYGFSIRVVMRLGSKTSIRMIVGTHTPAC